MIELIRRWRLGKQYGYETLFKNQDTRIKGKPGVILAEMGMPERYEFEFYKNYMLHVFNYSLPSFIRKIVLADKGIALVNPKNPLAQEAFRPDQLVDCKGSHTNHEGVPYVECDVAWRPPRSTKNPWDHGHFIYQAEGKSGAPDVCEKTGAKVAGWYYGMLIPEKKVAWRHQLCMVYHESVAELKKNFPHAEFCLAHYMDTSSMRKSVERLLALGCGTIIYQCFSNPVYSDFEDYAYSLPLIHHLVNSRAKVVCADQLGSQSAMRKAYLHMVKDQLAVLPEDASIFIILSAHGHPFKRETYDMRAPEYRDPLTESVRRILNARAGRCDLTWSYDEFADPYWDPKNRRTETLEAYRYAIKNGYDYVIEFPTESPAESTDLMIFHAMKKFIAFSDYDRDDPVQYTDWEQPLVRTYHEGKTTGIYAGCPVGPYRRHVVAAVVNSIAGLLDRDQSWISSELSIVFGVSSTTQIE
ncbi:MAG: hypothetical protein E3J30_00475 [Anaerolineales bacterium]|nr:MAG: hypothetical protein E3J30_00475 [Anaerolineales bacterium]